MKRSRLRRVITVQFVAVLVTTASIAKVDAHEGAGLSTALATSVVVTGSR